MQSDIEVQPEHELEVKAQAKIPAICQFINIFKNVLRFNPQSLIQLDSSQKNNVKTITPNDLEQSILRPHLDPLVGELVIRLIQRTKLKPKEPGEGGKGNGEEGSDLPVLTQSY